MTAFWVIHGNCLLYFIMVGIEISPRYLFFLNKSKFGWLWIITLDLLPLLPRWFFLSILRTGVVVPNQHVSSVFQPLSDRESGLHKEQLFHHRWATILQIVITLCYQSKVNEPNALLIHNAYVKVWFQMEVGRQCSMYAYGYNASCSNKEMIEARQLQSRSKLHRKLDQKSCYLLNDCQTEYQILSTLNLTNSLPFFKIMHKSPLFS